LPTKLGFEGGSFQKFHFGNETRGELPFPPP
jgi:hypothetical protein